MMLETRDLTVNYDLISALSEVSLAAEERTITTIVGSNGAGKTTLLKTISGLIRPASGEIRFLGERIDAASPTAIVRMGISQVPEGRELFPRISVYDNLMVAPICARTRRRSAVTSSKFTSTSLSSRTAGASSRAT